MATYCATAAAAALAGLIVVTVVVAVRAVVSDPMLDVGDSASALPTPPKVANPAAAAAAAAAATSAAGAAAVASGAPASIETLYGTCSTLKSVRRGDHEDAENAIYCALLGGWTRLVNESGTQGRGWRCEMMR